MASLACRRLEVPTTSISCLTRKCHENDGSNMTALKHQDSRQTHLLSCSMSDRNGFLGCASGTGSPDLRRSSNVVAATTHDLAASKCIFLDTAHTLRGSERLLRAQHNLSAAQMPEVTGRAQTVHGEGASLNKLGTMDGSASTASLFSMSSNSDDEELSSCASSEISSDGRLCSPRNEGPLDSLRTLCEALPLKRGLSRCFGGKSQSFSSLAEVCSVVDLAKPENPFVKRRRTENQACDRPRSAPAAAGISKRPYKSFHVISETMSTAPFRRL